MTKKRVLAGMRASGKLHIGNYLGGAKGMLALQDNPEYETLYMVADLHGLTTPYDTKRFASATRNVILDYLSAGLDPEKSVIFVQSQVPEHTELSNLLSTTVTVARMMHLPTYKEKVKQYPEEASIALLNYPVLMSSDILIYKAGLVPVGIDQEPHLEVAREIARKMNAQYGLDFPEPKRFATKGEYVPSLLGEGKMSKSVEGSYIALTDDLDTIRVKLSKVPTDGGNYDVVPRSGGVATLLKLVELYIGEDRKSFYENLYTTTGIRYSSLKEELSNAIFNDLKPIQESRKRFEEDSTTVNRIIKEGSEKARVLADETIKEVRAAMGLLTSI